MYESNSTVNRDLIAADGHWRGLPISSVVLEPADVALATECARIVFEWLSNRSEGFRRRRAWVNTMDGHVNGRLCEFSVAKWMYDNGVIKDYLGWLTRTYDMIKSDPGIVFEQPSDITAKLPCFSRRVTIDVKSWKLRWWKHPSAPGVLSTDQIHRHTGEIDLYIATRPHIYGSVAELRESKAQSVTIDVMFWTSLYHINRNMVEWCDPRKESDFGKASPHCITSGEIWFPMQMLLEPLDKPLPVYKWTNDVVINGCVAAWEQVNGRKWIGSK